VKTVISSAILVYFNGENLHLSGLVWPDFTLKCDEQECQSLEPQSLRLQVCDRTRGSDVGKTTPISCIQNPL